MQEKNDGTQREDLQYWATKQFCPSADCAQKAQPRRHNRTSRSSNPLKEQFELPFKSNA
jgi:hypothetical protein